MVEPSWYQADPDATSAGPGPGGTELGRGVHVNLMTAEETERIGAAHGTSCDPLVAVRSRYDPTTPLRMKQKTTPR